MIRLIDSLQSLLRNKRLKKTFTRIYKENIWRDAESRSGEGSNLLQTEQIRREIPQLLSQLGAKSMLDAPCGDFYWLKEVELPVERYIGVDIVNEVINSNNRLYSNSHRRFYSTDIVNDDLPLVDVVFCRDCLVHLNFDNALKALRNFKKSGSTYLLTTTFTDRKENSDLETDIGWRPLNLRLPPFNLSKEMLLLNEKCSEENGNYADKCLGLWLLRDISI